MTIPPLPRQLLIILGVAALIYFTLDFSRRLETLAQLAHTEQRLEQGVTQSETRQGELKSDLKNTRRPEFAERIARENYHWAREGDTVVATQKTPAPAPAAPPAVPAPPPQDWWQPFFDFLFGP